MFYLGWAKKRKKYEQLYGCPLFFERRLVIALPRRISKPPESSTPMIADSQYARLKLRNDPARRGKA
jgi:hypothetical protein